MAIPLLSNFAESLLQEPITMSDLTLNIDPNDASKFPAPGANEEFMIVLWDGVEDPEIMAVSANVSGVFTVTRAQEGTVARAWTAYSQVKHALTAGVFDYFLSAIDRLEGTSASAVSIGTGTKAFVTQIDKLFEVGQWILITSDADPTNNWMQGQVTAYNGVNLTVDVVRSSGAGLFSDWTIFVSGPQGSQGTAGAAGAAGAAGNDGQDGLPGTNGKTVRNGSGAPGAGLGIDGDFYIDTDADAIYGPKTAGAWGAATSLIGPAGLTGISPGKVWSFSTLTTDADPGSGILRANNATFASITKLFIDNLDGAAVDSTAWLDRLDDSTNTGDKGLLRLQKFNDPDIYMEFQITGAVVDDTGYREVPVTPISGDVPANATVLVATFSMTGDAGSAFIGLSDVPANFTGSAGKAPTVNTGETALEFTGVERLGIVRATDIDTVNTTLALTDAGKTRLMNNAASRQYTIPTNAAVAFPVDTYVNLGRYGAGAVVIAGDTGVIINGISAGSFSLPARYAMATLLKIDTNEWFVANYTAT